MKEPLRIKLAKLLYPERTVIEDELRESNKYCWQRIRDLQLVIEEMDKQTDEDMESWNTELREKDEIIRTQKELINMLQKRQMKRGDAQ